MEKTREIVTRVYAELLNQRRLELVSELVAEDAVWAISPFGVMEGRRAIEELMRELLLAFPDVHYFVERMVVEEDQAAVHWRTTATHLGAFLGVAGTGRPAPCCGVTWYRVEDGRVKECRGVLDAFGVLQRIGAIPELVRL
ncbi:MAG: ester cyclase [Acidobacteria bacterium]|nr:ester cyclase [Acidobacteriota bacterium]